MRSNNDIRIRAISYNLKYFFTNKGIVQIDNRLNENIIKYNASNLSYGINMLRENMQVKFNLGLISMEDYLFSSRKFLYEMMNKINSKNGTSILTEWERKYSSDTRIITENFNPKDIVKSYNLGWYGVETLYQERINNLIIKEDILGNIWGGIKSFAEWGWNNIKDTITKAMTCTSGQGAIECFMEGLRTVATSLLGVGVLTGVSFISPIGQIPNLIIFGALLIYDIWKMMTGKEYKVVDIVVDIVSLLTPLIAKGLGSLLKGVSNFVGLGKLAATSGGVLSKFLPTLMKGLGSLSGIISKVVSFFSIKLGIKWIADMSSTTTQGLEKITDEVQEGIDSEKEKLKGSDDLGDLDDMDDLDDLEDENIDGFGDEEEDIDGDLNMPNDKPM
jgi:hypothetical protein